MRALKVGQVTLAIDGTKILANASNHSAVSHGHATEQIERLEKAGAADSAPLEDGLTLPEGIARRRERFEFHGFQRDAADAEARDFWDIQHRSERLGAGHAEVRDRELAAAEMIGADRTLLALVGQRTDGRAQLVHRHPVRVADNGHHEAAGGIHCDTKMNCAVFDNLVAEEVRVQIAGRRQDAADRGAKPTVDRDLRCAECLAVKLIGISFLRTYGGEGCLAATR